MHYAVSHFLNLALHVTVIYTKFLIRYLHRLQPSS